VAPSHIGAVDTLLVAMFLETADLVLEPRAKHFLYIWFFFLQLLYRDFILPTEQITRDFLNYSELQRYMYVPVAYMCVFFQTAKNNAFFEAHKRDFSY